jgi:AcrR family transcriptional regulator
LRPSAHRSPRRRPRARDPEGTRRALRAAGTVVFARRGFAGATAQLIARRAGVNKAMINYHFGGKRGLYTAIVRESFSGLVERLRGAARASRPPPRKLADIVALFAATVAEAPDLPVMLLREVLSGGEHLDREVFAFLTSILAVVRETVDEGVRDGSFRPVDPLLTHLSIMGSLIFFFATAAFRKRALAEVGVGQPPPTAEQFVRHLQDLITRGLVAARPEHGAAAGGTR